MQLEGLNHIVVFPSLLKPLVNYLKNISIGILRLLVMTRLIITKVPRLQKMDMEMKHTNSTNAIMYQTGFTFWDLYLSLRTVTCFVGVTCIVILRVLLY